MLENSVGHRVGVRPVLTECMSDDETVESTGEGRTQLLVIVAGGQLPIFAESRPHATPCTKGRMCFRVNSYSDAERQQLIIFPFHSERHRAQKV